MSTLDKVQVLAEISLELIYNELKRRAAASGMSVDDLVAQAKENWQNAESAAEDLENKGH